MQVPVATATQHSLAQKQISTSHAPHHRQGNTAGQSGDKGKSVPPQAATANCVADANLVEDDIDWGGDHALQASVASPPADPGQSWTVQFLEGCDSDVDAARDRMLGKNVSHSHFLKQKSQAVSSGDNSSTLTGKAPVKHGTGAWIESDIQWDE